MAAFMIIRDKHRRDFFGPVYDEWRIIKMKGD